MHPAVVTRSIIQLLFRIRRIFVDEPIAVVIQTVANRLRRDIVRLVRDHTHPVDVHIFAAHHLHIVQRGAEVRPRATVSAVLAFPYRRAAQRDCRGHCDRGSQRGRRLAGR